MRPEPDFAIDDGEATPRLRLVRRNPRGARFATFDEVMDDGARWCTCDGHCGRCGGPGQHCTIVDGAEYVAIRSQVLPLHRWAEFFGMEAAQEAEFAIPMPTHPARSLDRLEASVLATCEDQARAARSVAFRAAIERARDATLIDVLARTPGSQFAEAVMERAVVAPGEWGECQWCRRARARRALMDSGRWWLETEALDVG